MNADYIVAYGGGIGSVGVHVLRADTLRIHNVLTITERLTCLAVNAWALVTAGFDGIPHVWSLIDGRCERALIGHTAPVRCMTLNGDV